jgi:hypothetical protein
VWWDSEMIRLCLHSRCKVSRCLSWHLKWCDQTCQRKGTYRDANNPRANSHRFQYHGSMQWENFNA